MSDQATIQEFVGVDVEEDSERSQAGDSTILFQFTGDQFVNEAIAELARRLADSHRVQVNVSPVAVTLPPDQEVDPALELIHETIENSLSRTHARTGAARQLNAALESVGAGQQDDRWVPPAQSPFPANDGGPTIYDDEQVDPETIRDVGLDPDDIPAVDSSEKGLYALAPEFVGNSSSKHFPESQVPRYRRYFEAFADTLRGEAEPDDAVCMNCGRRSMPAYKDTNGEYLEYNQTFTVLAAASGRSAALGYRSRSSSHRGRCAACLVAGFYYSLIPKIVRPTGTDDNDTRVFAPLGDLQELVNIRTDLSTLHQPVDTPTPDEYPGRSTLGDLYTDSHGMQTIEIYEQVLRHLNTTIEGDSLFQREISRRPTALTSYVSEVGRTRSIRAMETIDPGDWAYQAVERRSVGDDTYWPVADVLRWFTDLRIDSENEHVVVQDDLAFGILRRDPARVERAIFEVTKLLGRDDADATYVPHQGYRTDYFQFVMTQSTSVPDSIDDDQLDSIRKVATSLGRVFHGQDDIGVLIKLQNAAGPSTFLQAFEKAAMQAQKRSHAEPPSQWETSRDDDVSDVLKLISDRETFEPTKRMFVIHASLAAQYENASRQSDESGSGTGADGASSASATE